MLVTLTVTNALNWEKKINFTSQHTLQNSIQIRKAH